MAVQFTYHPDPVATGSLVAGDGAACDVCRGVRDLVYRGPVYSPIADEPTICAECIANGRAATELDAMFTDLGGDGWEDVPQPIQTEVLTRTPGFSGWQQEQWQAHCSDAMEFLGPVGHAELEGLGKEAVAALRGELSTWGWDDQQIDEFMVALDRDGMPTGYAFRCRHCGAFNVYADFT